ncbi:hypothetical protein [Rhizobium mayense]|uniref:hypothetical protein n=1 Tax=Rhizobium mayense TaxID=1312184 RepID=UPI00398C4917
MLVPAIWAEDFFLRPIAGLSAGIDQRGLLFVLSELVTCANKHLVLSGAELSDRRLEILFSNVGDVNLAASGSEAGRREEQRRSRA